MVWGPKQVVKQAYTNMIHQSNINIFIHLYVKCLHRLIHMKPKEIEESISLTTHLASFELLMTPSCTVTIPLWQHHFLRCDDTWKCVPKTIQKISDSTRMYMVGVITTHQLDSKSFSAFFPPKNGQFLSCHLSWDCKKVLGQQHLSR